jgi:hypothetical protein
MYDPDLTPSDIEWNEFSKPNNKKKSLQPKANVRRKCFQNAKCANPPQNTNQIPKSLLIPAKKMEEKFS